MHGFQQNETCQACSAPIRVAQDACPSCAAHLFWLVVPKRPLSALERKQFVTEMLGLTQQSIDQDYLDVDGNLWLPSDFWQQDPHGDSLRIFPWLSKLELHQHAQANQSTTTSTTIYATDVTSLPSEADEPLFAAEEQDTLPGVTEAELAQREQQAQPRQAEQMPLTAPAEQSTRAKPRPQSRPKITSATLAPPPKPIAPVAILLFFVLLGLSYLSLYVQRNQRDIAFVEARPTALEIPSENPDPQGDEANP